MHSDPCFTDDGLLLSPHLDALFEQELISFEDDGRMIVRPDLSLEVLRRWSVDPAVQTDPFRPGQQRHLNEHRESLANRWSSAKAP